MKKLRLFRASVWAFVMGLPFAAQAKADDAGDIFSSALGLTFSIIDVAGDS